MSDEAKSRTREVLLPPVMVTLRWCTYCGRDDRRFSLGPHGSDHHHNGIYRCPGTVHTLTYDLNRPAREDDPDKEDA